MDISVTDLSQVVPVTWRKYIADPRFRRFWYLGLVGLFLHGVADPLVTYLVGAVYGVGIETNRYMGRHPQTGS